MLDLVKDLGASPATQKETLMQLVKIAWEITWLALGKARKLTKYRLPGHLLSITGVTHGVGLQAA